jgi:transcription termination factor NusB
MWSKTQRYQVFAGAYRYLFSLENSLDQMVDQEFFELFRGKTYEPNPDDQKDIKLVEAKLAVLLSNYDQITKHISQFLKDPNKTNLTHLAIFYTGYLEFESLFDESKEDTKFIKNLINKYLNLLDEIGDKQSTGFVHAVLSKLIT